MALSDLVWYYLGRNVPRARLGVMLLTGALCAVGYSIRGTVGGLGEVVENIEIAFLVFVSSPFSGTCWSPGL